MARLTLATVVKLLLASLLVGWLLSLVDIGPQELLRGALGQVRWLIDLAVSWLGRSVSYLLLGAIIVVPAWLIYSLWKSLRGRR